MFICVQGVCLIDWGRSIDISLFADGTEFVGDSKTDGFRCTEMIEKKPWTFQVLDKTVVGSYKISKSAQNRERTYYALLITLNTGPWQLRALTAIFILCMYFGTFDHLG